MTLPALSNNSFKIAYVKQYYPMVYKRIDGVVTGYTIEAFHIIAGLLNRTLEVIDVEDYG